MNADIHVNSDSKAQRNAEAVMIREFSNSIGISLASKTLTLDDVKVQVDGYGEDNARIVIVEAYARHGQLKSAQQKKIYTDILKLALISHMLNANKTIETYILFADEQAATILTGSKWGAKAASLFKVKHSIISLADDIKDTILKAQRMQDIRKHEANSA